MTVVTQAVQTTQMTEAQLQSYHDLHPVLDGGRAVKQKLLQSGVLSLSSGLTIGYEQYEVRIPWR